VIAERLAAQYRLAEREPAIEVAGYNYRGDRSLTLQHKIFKYRPLHEENTKSVLKHLYSLWGHPITVHSVDPEGKVAATVSMPTSAGDRGLKIGDQMKYNI
jgi:stage V sporulation protein R